MRLFLLGATGRTGVEVVDMALERGHDVTTFVRSPHKITRQHARLRVVSGDPKSARPMAAALASHDAVLSALGPKVGEAMRPTTLLEDCAASALEAMELAGVRRYLVVSSALLFPGGGPVPAFFRTLIRHHLRDADAMERKVRSTALDWTIARPPRLVSEHDELYRTEVDAMPPGAPFFLSRLSWRALAAFLLDALAERRFVRKTVGVAR